jgi:amino acid transporter
MMVANFSFFFIIGVSLIFILMSGFLIAEWRKGVGISYTARIQSFAYLAFLLPLVVVSFMSLRMINQSNQNQILENNIERGNAISTEVS